MISEEVNAVAMCEFAVSKGAYGRCTLILTDNSSKWYKTFCVSTPSKCPYIAVCPQCATKNAATATFCSDCGKRLKAQN